jgi:hypothetical protein
VHNFVGCAGWVAVKLVALVGFRQTELDPLGLQRKVPTNDESEPCGI